MPSLEESSVRLALHAMNRREVDAAFETYLRECGKEEKMARQNHHRLKGK